MATPLPSLSDVEDAARQQGLGESASELHGALCGWLAGGGSAEADWLGRVLADDALPVPADGSVFEQLREASAAQLEDRDFDFDTVDSRPGASLWNAAAPCSTGAADFWVVSDWPRARIHRCPRRAKRRSRHRQARRGGPAGRRRREEDEDAMVEIEEFVRVAVLLLHGDCAMGPRHRNGELNGECTGISAQNYARRRKQLMRMDGDDAILVLPAAQNAFAAAIYPLPVPAGFGPLVSDRIPRTGSRTGAGAWAQARRILVVLPRARSRTRRLGRAAYTVPRARSPTSAWTMPIDRGPRRDPARVLEGRSRVYYHFGRDTDFDLKLIGWLNRVRAQMRMGAQPPHEFLELGICSRDAPVQGQDEV